MSEQTCKNCAYYIQHYALNDRRIFRVYCGHCAFHNPKHKRPDAKICENFVEAPSREDNFVSKEYLSKQLLQYMMELELLPKIE